MNVLWISNIVFPEANALLTGDNSFKSSGGWMLGAAEMLVKQDGIKLSVVSVSSKVKELTIVQGTLITYYIIPPGNSSLRYYKKHEFYFKEIKRIASPDIVHIHGTEYLFGLAYVNACGSSKVVVSIQGMKSVYYKYNLAGISLWKTIKNITIRDLIKGTMLRSRNGMYQIGFKEIELLRKVDHVIGRTSWDKAHTWAINPKLQYHFCNETLRPEFYTGEQWRYDTCKKHVIFLSQASFPIKGFHKLLEALPLVIREFPDTIVRVAGIDLSRVGSKYGTLSITGYGKIIKQLINQYQLQNHIHYVGQQDAIGIKCELLQCNVFICPSSIENSPNSLGEAQLLGTPCISSYVGGSMDMMVGNEKNLYRFEDSEMLAYKICQIFHDKDKQINMKETALARHNAEENCKQLLSIYKEIIDKHY